MGGMIARALFLLPNYVQDSVQTILTLNTPHRSPPIPLHRSLASFYSRLNHFWSDATSPLLEKVTIVSISGGLRDTLVAAELTNLAGIAAPNSSFSVNTLSIPDVRLETDHQCIVWCNQLVKKVTSALYTSIDPTTRKSPRAKEERLAVFKRLLSSGIPEGLGFSDPPPPDPPTSSFQNRPTRFEDTPLLYVNHSTFLPKNLEYIYNLASWSG